jgi:hypothetical protein
MAAPQQTALPGGYVLASGMQIVVTAINPTTGALVNNVFISDVSVSVDPGDSGPDGPPVPISPAYLPGEV